MKILIVANGFTGATLPLANKLSQEGNKVKCFYFVRRGSTCMESLDFDNDKQTSSCSVVTISKTNKLYQYLDKEVDVSLMPVWQRRLRMEKLLVGHVFNLLNSLALKNYIDQIIAEKPDVVNLIVHTKLEVSIASALEKASIPFTITFHEVLKSLSKKKELKEEVINALRFKCPIICHSEKTAGDLLELASNSQKLRHHIHIIHFGTFDSYLSYGLGERVSNQPSKYLLYLGHVHPYKGLKYLYEAVQQIGEELNGYKIVVAGNGFDASLSDMAKDKRFVVINRFIGNAELVGLIRGCDAIICPYTAASQSGLFQTGLVFHKPIIATKVGAFEEVVQDGENGILCEPSDASSLANSIKRFLNTSIGEKLSVPKMLSWEQITDNYLALYKSMIERAR